MESIQQTSRRSLWFKRWSRRADASFLSIGKVVHIARLKVDICRMAMLKSGVISSTAVSDQEYKLLGDDDADDEPLDVLSLLELLGLMPILAQERRVYGVAASIEVACAGITYDFTPTTMR